MDFPNPPRSNGPIRSKSGEKQTKKKPPPNVKSFPAFAHFIPTAAVTTPARQSTDRRPMHANVKPEHMANCSTKKAALPAALIFWN